MRRGGESTCMPKVRLLETSLWVPRTPEDLFPFFADAANLNVLTPPWLDFKIVTPLPIDMKQGVLIDYRIGLKGVPMKWRTLISAWEPPVRFIDEQIKGPYSLWRHEHIFVPDRGGTNCIDRVSYSHWGGPLAEKLLVRPDLERIFAYRKEKMAELFGKPLAKV
jgi:ligand-binding SRPBCC domain-containing protein